MKNKNDDKLFSRRTFLLGALQTAALGVLAGRLYWLQVHEGARYKTLSDRNSISTKLVSPSRGEILDRHGVPLAVNATEYRLFLVREQVQDLDVLLASIRRFITLEDYEIAEARKNLERTASFVPVLLKKGLRWREVSKLEVNGLDLPGIVIEEGEVRSYPIGASTAHIIGYTGVVSERDIAAAGENPSPLLKMPAFQIGKTGIERSQDMSLRGAAGSRNVEVDVRGRPVREIRTMQGRNGGTLRLTIDSDLQQFTQNTLARHKSASAVILDAHTGELYALASHPSFDPNQFVGGISRDRWEEILNNPAHPLTNKAISGQYPPGSTFKMMTALAALEHDVARAGTQVFCTGKYNYGDSTFRCWKLSGHGMVNAAEALEKSCDTYFYRLSTEIGIDKIADMARRFGLGQQFGFGLDEEKSGLIPTREWKKQAMNRGWQPGETIVASIGQGYIQSTPLQLAVMTARLVNGGVAVDPILFHGRSTPNWPKINVSAGNLALVRNGMDRVVNTQDGTAYAARISEVDMAYGGKTGTAQVARINRAERARGIMNEDLQWRLRHHALFVGYAPLVSPRYVCSVVVEHGGGGSAVAAPLARDLLHYTQKRRPALASREA